MKEKVAIIDSLGAHGSSHHYYLFGQADGLSKCNLDVSIYTNNVTPNLNYEKVKFFQFYINIYKSKSKIISGIRCILGSVFSLFHARFSGVKICHYHLFHVNILVLFDFILTKLLGMKVVYTIHDVVSFESSTPNKKLAKWIYKRVDKILTHNDFSMRVFKEHYTSIVNEIDVIPHGNYIPFLNIQTDIISSKIHLGIPQDKQILLFFGMIKKVKGLELLLNSLKVVVENNPDVILVIAGRVWENNFSVYQKIIDENNLADHCIIHNKFIPNEDVDHYYASSDLIVLPYKQIYQSGVLMMSMSYEKAVLVSNLPPFIDVVQDMETGFVFESENPTSLANKLNLILLDMNNLERIRLNGSNLMKTKYDWSAIALLTKKSYQSIL